MYTIYTFFDQDQTLRIRKGEDLFHFKDCNQNRPVLDLRPLGNIIRDPYILKDAQGIYRLFFTDNWYSNALGYKHFPGSDPLGRRQTSESHGRQ